MYLKGALQSAIAEVLGLHQTQISYDLKAIRKAWLDSSLRDFDKAKSQELAKIDNLEVTYWQAWEDSKGTTETETAKSRSDDNQEAGYTKVKKPIGDLRALAGVERCIMMRSKMMGFDAPIKTESHHSGKVELEQTITDKADQIWTDDKTNPGD